MSQSLSPLTRTHCDSMRLGRACPGLGVGPIVWFTQFACFLLIFAGTLHAQQSFGTASKEPPNEDRYIYKQVPDFPIHTIQTSAVKLSTIWQSKPLLFTMVFTHCTGVCSPFLRSLKSAVSEAGGLGKEYRVLVLSFDPKDTVADMDMMADSLGVKSDPGWIFGTAAPSDIVRLAAATGFWFQWDQPTRQYDHPAVVVTIERGEVVRMLVGATVPRASLSEVVQELRGKFVASYALPGKVAFRCFEYDPSSGRYSLDWGVLLMLLPSVLAMFATACVFFLGDRPMPTTTISPNDFSLIEAPVNFSESDVRAIVIARQQAHLQPAPGIQDEGSPTPVGKSPEEQ
jgi:cytochrome oxidase Cu insertion factor (SCO1/SenC/PrrC family)